MVSKLNKQKLRGVQAAPAQCKQPRPSGIGTLQHCENHCVGTDLEVR